MTEHIINTNKLYILSGLSGSGKSTFLKRIIDQGLKEDCVICPDTIRKNLLGTSLSIDKDGIKEILYGWEIGQEKIFNIAKEMLNIRLQEKLTTFFDATNLTDDIRSEYVKLAEEHGISTQVIIFNTDIETIKERLSKRKERFDFSVVEEQNSKFLRTSKFNYITYNEDDTVRIIPNFISTTKLDVIGDVHGLFNELILLLNKAGWTYDNQKMTLNHDDKERKLLFLGDIIDRGTQSIETLQLVKKLCDEKKAYFLLGNHENKLLKALNYYFKNNILQAKSFSNAETLVKLIQLEKDECLSLYQFLKKSPSQYSLWVNENENITESSNIAKLKFGFVHSDIDYFDPMGIPASVAMYGRNKISQNDTKQTDALYDINFTNKLVDHIIIRGHIPNISESNYVYSLDRKQAFEGELLLLQLDKLIPNIINSSPTYQSYENLVIKQKSTFNYDNYMKNEKELFFALNKLEKEKLLTKKQSNDGLIIYKYSKKVFFKNLWGQNENLLKARGIVLDISGNIIQHPFDKIFNFGENQTGSKLPLTNNYQVVEKMNGFLGCITKHPFKEELLITTTGSFESDFVNYIKDYITPEVKSSLLKYFFKNNQTLMFEVIHPKDPHIIPYEVKDHGLWLIGARGKNIEDNEATELELDNIAKILNFKRVNYFNTDLTNILELLKTSTLEGFIVRDIDTNKPIFKAKTDFYLTSKFVGRMNAGNIKMMYKTPEKFKEEKLEEEFYPIVDQIINKIPLDTYIAMEQTERVNIVTKIIDELRDNNKHKKNRNSI